MKFSASISTNSTSGHKEEPMGDLKKEAHEEMDPHGRQEFKEFRKLLREGIGSARSENLPGYPGSAIRI